MNSIRKIFSNKWVKFGIVAFIYLLFVIWIGNYWLLLGLAIVYDLYISKKVKWAFWKKRYKEGEKRSSFRDWIDAAIFAIIAAVIIRMFFVEAYVIPSGSMERSLLIGDYLFVSKTAYGPKMPNTPISFPLVHNTLPLSTAKSFVEWVKWPYKRLAGFGPVQRNDVVVFNFPHGDTVIASKPNEDYYYYARAYGRDAVKQKFELITRPVDKEDNYVKRCVAIAGDTLTIVHGDVLVNGQAQVVIPHKQYRYTVATNGTQINPKELEKMDISLADCMFDPQSLSYSMPLTEANVKTLEGFANVKSVSREDNTEASAMQALLIFPFSEKYPWTEDNFGPLWVPKKGATAALTPDNLPLYRRIIEVYEKNKLELKDGEIFINDVLAHSYTFKMDYYFMMGDNRHNSLDSRYWGFVPEDHVVGKAWLVWFSSDPNKSFPKNIRWSRMFRTVK